jgi:hypothetical protein
MLCAVLGLAALLGATDLHAQFVPVVAKMGLTKEDIVQGKVVDRLTKEGSYYRASDGSVLRRWTSVNGDEKLGEIATGSLFDNKNVVSYRLNFKNRTAYLDAPPQGAKPVRPQVLDAQAAKGLGEDSVHGIACTLFPVQIAPRDRAAFSAGQTCRSVKYDLELKQDLTYPSSSGRTIHTIFELYDVQLGTEPDPSCLTCARISRFTHPKVGSLEPSGAAYRSCVV